MFIFCSLVGGERFAASQLRAQSGWPRRRSAWRGWWFPCLIYALERSVLTIDICEQARWWRYHNHLGKQHRGGKSSVLWGISCQAAPSVGGPMLCCSDQRMHRTLSTDIHCTGWYQIRLQNLYKLILYDGGSPALIKYFKLPEVMMASITHNS